MECPHFPALTSLPLSLYILWRPHRIVLLLLCSMLSSLCIYSLLFHGVSLTCLRWEYHCLSSALHPLSSPPARISLGSGGQGANTPLGVKQAFLWCGRPSRWKAAASPIFTVRWHSGKSIISRGKRRQRVLRAIPLSLSAGEHSILRCFLGSACDGQTYLPTGIFAFACAFCRQGSCGIPRCALRTFALPPHTATFTTALCACSHCCISHACLLCLHCCAPPHFPISPLMLCRAWRAASRTHRHSFHLLICIFIDGAILPPLVTALSS